MIKTIKTHKKLWVIVRLLYQRRFEKQPITALSCHICITQLYQRRFEKQPITVSMVIGLSVLLYQRRFEKQPITLHHCGSTPC